MVYVCVCVESNFFYETEIIPKTTISYLNVLEKILCCTPKNGSSKITTTKIFTLYQNKRIEFCIFTEMIRVVLLDSPIFGYIVCSIVGYAA